MYRFLTGVAVAVLTGLTPALAAEPTTPPTGQSATPEASKEATTPESGKADTSAGAKEQSSSPPEA
jgi:hypothetical protein